MAFARNGEVRVYYETFGVPSDPALLLVNGLGSQCVNYRVEWCERFAAAGHHVIRYDNRDVGQSSARARQRFTAAAPVDRDSYIADHLANLRTWGSPACFDPERSTANAAEAFDRCFDPAGQARQIAAVMASGSRTAALRDIDVPTLVLHGDADTLIDASGGRRTADAIPGARFVLVEGMGHDYPPQYWDRIVELVSGHTRSAV